MSMLLPDRLRLLRQEKNLTQLAMARKILVPRVTYTHYELGKRTPDLETLVRLAHVHQVSVDYLLGVTLLRPTLEQWLTEWDQTGDTAAACNLYPVCPDIGRRIADQPSDQLAEADAGDPVK
jgi:transcriptional regulator with XRE-family HTH domain